jgi:hypothetical protein
MADFVAPEAPEADDRPECYVEIDPDTGRQIVVIRASAIGGCIRNIIAARMGIRAVPFKEADLRRMNEGVIHEPHILKHLNQKGWLVDETQAVLELAIAGGKILVRGHSDAAVTSLADGHKRVAEAKAFGRDVYKTWIDTRWAEFRRYAWQLSCYMHTTGLPGLMAVKNRDTGEVDVWEVDEPPVPLNEFKARAIKIASATDMPPCDPVSWLCQRYFLHESAVEIDPVTGLEVKRRGRPGSENPLLPPAPTDLPAEVVPVFDELARAYCEAREEETRAQTKKKEVGRYLAEALDEFRMTKAATDRYGVTMVTRTDSRVDAKGLKAKYPEIYAEFERKSTSTFPKVTEHQPAVEAGPVEVTAETSDPDPPALQEAS